MRITLAEAKLVALNRALLVWPSDGPRPLRHTALSTYSLQTPECHQEPGVNSWRTRVRSYAQMPSDDRRETCGAEQAERSQLFRLPQDLSTYVIRVVAVSHEALRCHFWDLGTLAI